MRFCGGEETKRALKRLRDRETDRDEATESERPRDIVEPKKRRREGTDTEPAAVKALRQENEELREERDRSREEFEGLKLRNAKLEAGCQTPQEKDKEFKLPTEVWAIIAGKLDQDDVNQDVLHGCGTPLRRLGNDSPGID